MASSMASFLKTVGLISKKTNVPTLTVVRNSSLPPKKKPKRGTIRYRNLIQSTVSSLESRGFLRTQKPYSPPGNVSEVVSDICQRVLGPGREPEAALTRDEKFELLNTCFKELNHSVPNSSLHKIVNVNDVHKFYETPVCTKNPYDVFLEKEDLPPNLYLQPDYLRYNEAEDELFGGVSPFPGSSTIVTSIKGKKKYKGTQVPPHKNSIGTTEFDWPDAYK